MAPFAARALLGVTVVLALMARDSGARADGEIVVEAKRWRTIPSESGPTNYYSLVNDPAGPYIHARYLPNKIVLLADGGAGQAWLGERLAYLKTALPHDGKAQAYVCENGTCKLPTGDPVKLREMLAK